METAAHAGIRKLKMSPTRNTNECTFLFVWDSNASSFDSFFDITGYTCEEDVTARSVAAALCGGVASHSIDFFLWKIHHYLISNGLRVKYNSRLIGPCKIVADRSTTRDALIEFLKTVCVEELTI